MGGSLEATRCGGLFSNSVVDYLLLERLAMHLSLAFLSAVVGFLSNSLESFAFCIDAR